MERLPNLLDRSSRSAIDIRSISRFSIIVYLDIQVPHIERVIFDELAAGFDGVTHQHSEDFVGFDGSSIRTCKSERLSGFIVVSHNCSGFISPSPL
jgi:hypothetical protein